MFFSKEKISEFKIMTLSIRSMRGTDEYEIICGGDMSEVFYYTRFIAKEDRERVLEKKVSCSTESIIKLFNDCGIMKWDGFDGPNPKWICDGYMFTFTAEVNNGKIIRAEGSNNFPKHYGEFKNAIRNMLFGD